MHTGLARARSARISLLAAVMLLGLASAPPGRAPECRVEGDAVAGDLERARAACDRAVERFALLFGAPPPAGVVELSDSVTFFSIERYAPAWKLVGPTSARLRDFFAATPEPERTIESSVATQWEAVLPHELGHVMLIAEADRRRPADTPARRLPDWLHEGTAVWMEPPALRSGQMVGLRALRPYVPPIDELLSFTAASDNRDEAGSVMIQTFYPCATEEACGGRPHWSRIFSVRTRQLPDGSVQVDTTFHTRPPPSPTPLGANFYPLSASLVRYLFDRGGAAATGALLDRYVHASPGRPVSLAGLPGLPRSAAGVQADWHEWFTRWILAD